MQSGGCGNGARRSQEAGVGFRSPLALNMAASEQAQHDLNLNGAPRECDAASPAAFCSPPFFLLQNNATEDLVSPSHHPFTPHPHRPSHPPPPLSPLTSHRTNVFMPLSHSPATLPHCAASHRVRQERVHHVLQILTRGCEGHPLLRPQGLLQRARQGLTLVHFSAQPDRFAWVRGCA